MQAQVEKAKRSRSWQLKAMHKKREDHQQKKALAPQMRT